MKKLVILIICIVIFVFSIICGFLINAYMNFSKKESEFISEDNKIIKNNNEIINTSVADEIVSPNAIVIKTQKYAKCGHIKTEKESVPRDIINLNKEKVEEYYSDWKIDSYSSNEISISKINYGICDEHYILRESNGYISISCKNDIGEYIFKGLTDISTQYLSTEDLEKLQKGIEVIGKENLNKCLEDFE